MSGSFLDTTVLIHLAEPGDKSKELADSFISANQPATVPYYAFQELLTGRLRILCDTHNALLVASNIGEAALALLRRSPAEGRKREAKQQALMRALSDIFSENPNGPRDAMKKEGLQALALTISRLWLRARSLKRVDSVQPLACFNDGKVTYDSDGALRGPQGSFNCLSNERCAAAAYIYEDQSALKKLIDALHPDILGPALGNKTENTQRRKALKDLLQSGPKQFNKRQCRALGDAYFAVMCPPGSVVATSNLSDHIPLCNALGKSAKQP